MPLVLDFEKIVPVPTSSSGQPKQDVNLYQKLIGWAHQYEPSQGISAMTVSYYTTRGANGMARQPSQGPSTPESAAETSGQRLVSVVADDSASGPVC